jgi:SAM-dependent methyltransferase
MDQNTYQSQDRGSQEKYAQYLKDMDAIAVEKIASASSFFDHSQGNIIVDVGMASGTSSHILALLFPQVKIIGVDINPTMVAFASGQYQLSNLEFRVDDGEALATFKKNSVDGFFNCSAIHHITSFNGYDPFHAYNTLKRQTELLKTNGILVVRDFVKPPEMEVILELSELPEDAKPSDTELLLAFSKTARSLANPGERGFPLNELPHKIKNKRRFQLFYADATEFIRRKDYYENWEIELQEEYGYFTQPEFEEIYASLGLRVIVSLPIYNPWIVRNRYRGKFALYDKNLKDIGFPPTNFLIAGEKVKNKGTSIKIVRHLPDIGNTFLKYSAYQDVQSEKIYDLVLRPNSVVDILPYFIENKTVGIIAKHGYPRPFVNIKTDSPIIDEKHYGGYIIEGLTATNDYSIGAILADKIGEQEIAGMENALEYFTSPGGINEKVGSVLVELKNKPSTPIEAPKGYSGFANSGTIRTYDAVQLLKTAQTGALVEARLELNIYNLLRKLCVPFPHWLGEKIEIFEVNILDITTLNDLLNIKETRFVPTDLSAGYLQKQRAKFAEAGIPHSSNILEFVIPNNVSTNTLTTLPVFKHHDEIYVGLEIRNLPVPQLHTGNSSIPVVPSIRLPKEVATYNDIENFIGRLKIFGTTPQHFFKLGEKYFPSIGLTPEQAYPYVVALSQPGSELKWVSLKELYNNLEKIKDGHLLVSIVRLVHALDTT